jgi:hypothetical protein
MVLLHHFLVQVVHQVKGAKATMLTYRDVNHHAHEAHLDDFNVCLVHQHDIFELRKLFAI